MEDYSLPSTGRRSALLLLTLALILVEGAGGSDIRFQEVSTAWNADFHHRHGGYGEFFMIESMGSGVAIFDYDDDGDQDLFWVDSGELRDHPLPEYGSVLMRNEGGGNFLDVTAAAGLGDLDVYGMGVTAGDVDGDADIDLYVTAFGPNRLLRNEGNGRFLEVTTEAGVGDSLWGSSAAFADVDRDGDLDLYVTNYVDFTYENNPPCGKPKKGLRSYCHPDVYNGVPDVFYRNRGDGTFENATESAGLSLAVGTGLGVAFVDFDDDLWPDIYVSNDMVENFLFMNQGDGTFEDLALLTGTALSDLGRPEAGMGIAIGDVDGNGTRDLVVTHLDLQTNAFYRNIGGGLFVEARYASGVAKPSMYNVGFGVALADIDNDQDLDLVVANGHIIHNAELFGTGTTFKQANQVMSNDGHGRFTEVFDCGLDKVEPSRGMALGDLDGDGDLDLAISNTGEKNEIYENLGANGSAWMQVELLTTAGNRRAIGARLELDTGAGRLVREVRTASSYQSQNALAVHFGLGELKSVKALDIHWPDGRRQRFTGLAAGKRILVVASRPDRRSSTEAVREDR